MRAKRILTVSLISLTIFSFGMGLVSLKAFTLLAWLIISLQIELGISFFALAIIGMIIGYCWATDADEDESFIDYFKGFIKSTFED